jgi:2-polyprenyl-3-methyl-5-hydroxy-6-metoxy-1,4-benzoquinol methylase
LNLEQSIIEEVITDVRKHLDKNFVPRKVLDFGCGVGRLLIPLSKLCEEVVGTDVSDSMLAKADKGLKKRDIHNFQLLKSDDDLLLLNGKLDFIHSYIVFQHIPVKRRAKNLVRLLDCLEQERKKVFQHHHQLKLIVMISADYFYFYKIKGSIKFIQALDKETTVARQFSFLKGNFLRVNSVSVQRA